MKRWLVLGALSILIVGCRTMEQSSTPRLESVDIRGHCRGGVPTTAGATHQQGSTIHLTAHGSEFGHHCGQDQGRFAFMPLTGDFDVSVQVASMSNHGAKHFKGHATPAKGGLMVRESNDPGARYVAIWAVSNDDPEHYPDAYHFDARLSHEAWLGSQPKGQFVYGYINRRHGERFVRDYPNVWVRLKREGHRFSSFISKDGVNWTSPSTPHFDLDLPRVLYVGVALSSAPEGPRDARSTAVFQNLRGLPSNATKARPMRSSTQVGPLRLHHENPHYFEWRGKPLAIVTSAEHYGALINLDFDYRKYLDTLAKEGMAMTRLFSGAYIEPDGAFNIRSNTLAPLANRLITPWPRSDQPGYAGSGNKFDLSKWDDAYFARLHDFMQHAEKRGIIVEFTLFCPMYEEMQWRLSPMNAVNNINGLGNIARTNVYTLDRHGGLLAVQEQLTRKLVTELNRYDNLYFEMCNEPYFGGVTMDWQHRIADVIVETERSLPKKHLIAQNIANNSARITNPHPAISIFNFHYATPPDTVAINYHLNKVIGDDETGFRGTNDAPYRTEAWDFIIAGGGLYNNLDYSFAAGYEDGTFPYPATQPGGGNPAFRRQMKILSDFIHGFDLPALRPDNSVIRGGVPAGGTARALVEPGRAMAIYVRNEGSTGPWSARWTGFIEAPVTGDYTFHTFSNDGVRLWVNEEKLIDDWTDHGEKEDIGRIRLDAGQRYPVRLEYFYNGGQGAMKLWWTPPAGKKEPIPANAFRLPGTGWGLRGEYFHGTDLTRKWGQRDDGQINFAWGVKPPFAGEAAAGATALEVELPEGKWLAEWVDTKSGETTGSVKISGGGVRAVEAPSYETDIALRLRRTGR